MLPKSKVNDALPKTYSYFKAHSPVRRAFNQKPATKTNNLNEKVKTARVNNVTTVGPKAVVSAAVGYRENAVKSSTCWIWRPTGNVIDNYLKTVFNCFKRFDYVDYKADSSSAIMTGNQVPSSDYQEVDVGFVAFAESPKGGKITRKGKNRTGKLDFEDVYFVKELKFNVFSVSQMCDNKNNVLFTDTECLVLSPDFKLLAESQVLLKVPKQNNFYPPYTRKYMPLRPDLSFAGLDDSVYKNKVSKTETSISKTSKDIVEKLKTVRPSAPIIEDWDIDSDNDSMFRHKIDQRKLKFTKINFVKSDENVKSVNKENTHKQVEYPTKSQSPRDNTRN
ncbi:hypothetical protein Tco_1457353 [Tanacetum coccineum]